MVNLIKSFIAWAKKADKSDWIAAGCVTFFAILLIPIAGKLLFTLNSWLKLDDSFGDQLIYISVGAAIVGSAAILASICGNAFAPCILRSSERELISINILNKYGISSAPKFRKFIGARDLKVYLTKKEIPENSHSKAKCTLEPLINVWTYPPYLAGHYYSENRLYFEKADIDAVFINLAAYLVTNWPDLVRAQINADMANTIEDLKVQLDDARESISKSNLSEGPYKTAAKLRLLLIAESYAAIKLQDSLMANWQEETEYTKPEINAAFASLLVEDHELKKLLLELNPKVNLEELREEILQILRIGMRDEAIDWGGQAKPTLRSIIEKLAVKGELKIKK